MVSGVGGDRRGTEGQTARARGERTLDRAPHETIEQGKSRGNRGRGGSPLLFVFVLRLFFSPLGCFLVLPRGPLYAALPVALRFQLLFLISALLFPPCLSRFFFFFFFFFFL